MSCLGNLIWFLCGGAAGGFAWFCTGCLWCISIVGFPVGVQCFKFALLSFFPFGKEVHYGGGVISLGMNVVWLLISGIWLAIGHLICGIFLCITIIGFPFGLQHFKLAKLALMPFGADIY